MRGVKSEEVGRKGDAGMETALVFSGTSLTQLQRVVEMRCSPSAVLSSQPQRRRTASSGAFSPVHAPEFPHVGVMYSSPWVREHLERTKTREQRMIYRPCTVHE